MVRYLVLGFLRTGRPYHGYALMKLYCQGSGLQISAGNFYRELQHLVVEGLVRTVRNPPGADARRAPYEITDLGIAAFDAWLAEPNSTGAAQHDDDLSTRTLFLADADPVLARRLLAQWREELWIRSKILERERDLALRADATESFAALPFLLTRRLKRIAADLEFLDEFRSAFEQWTAAPVTQRRHERHDAAFSTPRRGEQRQRQRNPD
jgi:DNA-binding PadR family transcriptional regulator